MPTDPGGMDEQDGRATQRRPRAPGKLRTYLQHLQPPNNWLDFTDLISKTVVALAAALIAAGLWAYNHHKSQIAAVEQQRAAYLQEQREESAEGRDTIDMFLKFMPDSEDSKASIKLTTLSSYCNDMAKARSKAGSAPEPSGWDWFGLAAKGPPASPAADNATTAVPPAGNSAAAVVTTTSGEASPAPGALAVYASSVTGVLCQAVADRGQTQLGESAGKVAAAAQTAVKDNNGLGYANSPAATSQNAAVAASEAAEPVGATTAWYAVVATLPFSQAASVPQIVASLNTRLKQGGAFDDVNIYCTRISRSIALTSGREKTASEAKGRVRLLRNLGLVSDAFAQPNRDWVRSPDRQVPNCPALAPAPAEGS